MYSRTHNNPALLEFDGEFFHSDLSVVRVEDDLGGRTFPSHGQSRLVAGRGSATFKSRHIEAIGGRTSIRSAANDNLLNLLPIRCSDAKGRVLIHAHMVLIRCNQGRRGCVLVVTDVQPLRRSTEADAVSTVSRRCPTLSTGICGK